MNTASKRIPKRLGMTIAGMTAAAAIMFASQAFAQATSTASTTSSTTTAGTLTGTAHGPVSLGNVTLIAADPIAGTATVSWTTDVPASGQAFYGRTSAYDRSTTYDPTLNTYHRATLTGLTPGALYHFDVGSSDDRLMTSTMSFDYAFTMPPLDTSAGTSTATSTPTSNATSSASDDIALLQSRIDRLQSLVDSLQGEIASLQAEFSAIGSTRGSTQTGSSSGQASAGGATIAPNSASVRTGTSVDFTGRGFWNDEPVTVMNNGQTVATARADGGGNFSTGSLPVSAAPGASETYTFIGQWSGITGSGTVNVTQ